MSGIIQTMMNAGGALPPIVYLVSSSGTGSYTTPAGYTKCTVEAIGGGGSGFGNNTANNRAGGGGGTYAISNADIAVTPSSTVVYYSVGAAGADSWVNIGTNSAPGAATVGALAKAGTAASSGTGGTGLTTSCIGATKYAGGTGGTKANSVGGGGAGSAGAASAQTAGTSTWSMGGGTGGAAGAVGTAPGGGGGSDTVTGTNRAGAIGRVRIVFKP